MPSSVGGPLPIRPRRPQPIIKSPLSTLDAHLVSPASSTTSSSSGPSGTAPFRMPPSPPPSDGDEVGGSSSASPAYSPPIVLSNPRSILASGGGGAGGSIPQRMGSPPPGNMATRSVPRATRSKLASAPPSSSSTAAAGPSRLSATSRGGGGTERGEGRYPMARTDSEAHATAQAYAQHLEQEHAFGGTHWLPLVFAVVPGIGAVFHGEAESWTDGLVILLGGIFLWQMAKIPWQMYTSARITRLLTEARHSHRSPTPHAASEIHRYELISLILTIASPLSGLLLLQFLYLQVSAAAQPSLINRTSLVLYGLGASVRPLTHLTDLVLERIHHLQTLAQPPPQPAIAHLRNEVSRVREDLAALRSVGATQADVRHLRDTLDLPLGQLSRAIRRTVRAEEGMRNNSEERFSVLEVAVDEMGRRIERDERIMRRLEAENEQLRTTPIAAVTALFGHLVGLSGSRGKASGSDPSSASSPRAGGLVSAKGWTDKAPFVLFFFPLNVAALAFAYVGSVMIGSSAAPLPRRVEGSAALSPSSSSSSYTDGGLGSPPQPPDSILIRGRNGKGVKGKGKARFASPDGGASISSGSAEGEADDLLLD